MLLADFLQVEVTDPDTGVTWFFDGNCWLGHDPRGVAVGMMRRLKASRTDPRSLRALVNYKVRGGVEWEDMQSGREGA